MKIGIDISQLAYPNTGVANYLTQLLGHLVEQDKENEYILFFSSMRRSFQLSVLGWSDIPKNVKLRTYKFPPLLLDFLWNRLHIMPIEGLIGDIDVFITSDWTEPPAKKAKKFTFLYDLIVYKYPRESTAKIVETQKRKLKWVKKESDMIFCISEATKKDAKEILRIGDERLKVVYPGNRRRD